MNYKYFLHSSLKNLLLIQSRCAKKDHSPKGVHIHFKYAIECTNKKFKVCMEVCACNHMPHMTKTVLYVLSRTPGSSFIVLP